MIKFNFLIYNIIIIFSIINFNINCTQTNNIYKEENSFKFMIDKKIISIIYFIPKLKLISKNHKDLEIDIFNSSIFKLPKFLEISYENNLPFILIIPENYKELVPWDDNATYIESIRTALTWTSVYFRFKKIDLRILLFSDKDKLSKNNIKKAIYNSLNIDVKNQNQEYFKLSPELQIKAHFFKFENLLNDLPKNKKISLNKYKINKKTENSKVKISPKLQIKENKKRVLITGGVGFLGSHLTQRLLNMNYQVIVVDNLFCGNLKNLEAFKGNQDFEYYNLDVTKEFEIEGPLDGIVHLASLPSPKFYYNNPIETLLSGLDGTKNTLNIAKEKNARYLFSSSSEFYGDPEISPQTEQYPGRVNPIGKRSQYDQSKRAAEILIKLYYQNYNTDVRIARIFNTYGPHMRLDDGRVITNFICACLENKPMKIYGSGMQTRSFIYVDDMIEGLIKLFTAENLEEFRDRIFNIGNPDQEYFIKDLAQKINILANKYLNLNLEIINIENPDIDDPKLRKPDITKAVNILNYKPSISIEEGLEKTFTYFLNNKK